MHQAGNGPGGKQVANDILASEKCWQIKTLVMD
jgi:hypothetical protein